MFPFLETIRIEGGRPLRLELHEVRMTRTRQHAQMADSVPALPATGFIESPGSTGTVATSATGSMETSVSLREYIARLQLPSQGIHKLRILYSDRIDSHTIESYTPRRIESLRLVYDDSINYRFKSSDRTAFDRLLSKRDGCDEILIVQNGCVTDTSFSNIAFLRQGRWVTPDTTLLEGVMRRDLLERGLLEEARITPADLFLFEQATLINSMLDPGTITVAMDRILK